MSPARRPWASLSPAEKIELVEPMLTAGLAYSTIAYHVGAPSRNSIASLATKLRRSAEKKSSSEGRTSSPGLRRQPAAVANMAGNTFKDEPVAAADTAGDYLREPAIEATAAELGVVAWTIKRALVDLKKASRSVPIFSNKTGPKPKQPGPLARSVAVRQESRKADKPHGAGVASAVRAKQVPPDDRPEIKITSAAAFDPIPGTTPVAYGSPGCKWPVDGVDGRGLLACGQSRDFSKREDEPYCRSHVRLAYSSPSARTLKTIREAAKEAA